jgi:hypothetical protein
MSIDCADPRLIFLERATAKLLLIEAGFVDLDTAFADLVPAFRQIAVPPCQCARKILDSFERYDQEHGLAHTRRRRGRHRRGQEKAA